MRIKTTVRIPAETLQALVEASHLLQVTRSDMIARLLKHLARKTARTAFWTRVRYQERRRKEDWKQVHVSPKGDEYELFLDLRKVRKFSVSFLVTWAVEECLDDLMDNCGNGDNYHFKNYAVIHFFNNDIECWLFCWGIPPELTALP